MTQNYAGFNIYYIYQQVSKQITDEDLKAL